MRALATGRSAGGRPVAVADPKSQVEAGVALDESGDQPRREIFCRRNDADREPPARAGAHRAHRLDEFAHRAVARAGEVAGDFARGVEFQSRAGAVEQRHPDFRLQALEPRGERGWSHIEKNRGCDQRARLGDRLQGSQL